MTLNNSIDVIGQLYAHGYKVSRERVARISDLLWPAGDHRPSPVSHRRWTDEQVEVMRAALVLHDDLGVSLDRIGEMVSEAGSAEAAVGAMAHQIEVRLQQLQRTLADLNERVSA
jgi:hypothetical protein